MISSVVSAYLILVSSSCLHFIKPINVRILHNGLSNFSNYASLFHMIIIVSCFHTRCCISLRVETLLFNLYLRLFLEWIIEFTIHYPSENTHFSIGFSFIVLVWRTLLIIWKHHLRSRSKFVRRRIYSNILVEQILFLRLISKHSLIIASSYH
jgi:hypothetical protein